VGGEIERARGIIPLDMQNADIHACGERKAARPTNLSRRMGEKTVQLMNFFESCGRCEGQSQLVFCQSKLNRTKSDILVRVAKESLSISWENLKILMKQAPIFLRTDYCSEFY
jgi:hypothetical protein